MKFSSRRIRPLFTLGFVVLGGVGAHFVANWYFQFIDRVLKGESPDILGIIPQTPTQLSDQDKLILQIVCVALGALLGFVFERLAFMQVTQARRRWEKMAPQDKIVFFTGIILGLILTALLRSILATPDWINAALAVLFCYLSVLALDSLKEQIRFYYPQGGSMKADIVQCNRPKLLDTNVIIDGRIADICRAGFIEGPIFVPKFVLEELQQIADSSDSLKRARGRRGLDILSQMQKERDVQVPDFATSEPGEEVDARLVKVARDVQGSIITNDFNLNKVAGLQGVEVLNINELANAVKPVVLPGEEMCATINKEGKEKEQGIGYLDDGTMIVVEGARKLIGETLDVCVTSVLQTVQGKMIFARTKEIGEQGNGFVDDSIRSYSGGRPRRKIAVARVTRCSLASPASRFLRTPFRYSRNAAQSMR